MCLRRENKLMEAVERAADKIKDKQSCYDENGGFKSRRDENIGGRLRACVNIAEREDE